MNTVDRTPTSQGERIGKYLICVRWPTLEAFRADLQVLPDRSAIQDLLQLEGCPCFTVMAGNTIFDGHCWRTCMECERCGLHVTGDDDSEQQQLTVRWLKARLDRMNWYGRWEVKWTPRD